MDLIYLIVINIGAFAGLYIMSEIRHCRKGHDVYEWTKKLVAWIDKK